jgi:hypothetical protein
MIALERCARCRCVRETCFRCMRQHIPSAFARIRTSHRVRLRVPILERRRLEGERTTCRPRKHLKACQPSRFRPPAVYTPPHQENVLPMCGHPYHEIVRPAKRLVWWMEELAQWSPRRRSNRDYNTRPEQRRGMSTCHMRNFSCETASNRPHLQYCSV